MGRNPAASHQEALNIFLCMMGPCEVGCMAHRPEYSFYEFNLKFERFSGDHDPRVVAAARQARVSLKPRLPRVFDEVVDIVNFDLVLVLDHFDLTEVRLPSRLQLACMLDNNALGSHLPV